MDMLALELKAIISRSPRVRELNSGPLEEVLLGTQLALSPPIFLSYDSTCCLLHDNSAKKVKEA